MGAEIVPDEDHFEYNPPIALQTSHTEIYKLVPITHNMLTLHKAGIRIIYLWVGYMRKC